MNNVFLEKLDSRLKEFGFSFNDSHEIYTGIPINIYEKKVKDLYDVEAVGYLSIEVKENGEFLCSVSFGYSSIGKAEIKDVLFEISSSSITINVEKDFDNLDFILSRAYQIVLFHIELNKE